MLQWESDESSQREGDSQSSRGVAANCHCEGRVGDFEDGADNRRSYFFTDALQILATDQMNEIPGIFESVEKALQAGYYVAGFVSYEAGYHFDRSDGLCGRPGRLRRSAGVVRHIPGAAQLGRVWRQDPRVRSQRGCRGRDWRDLRQHFPRRV